MEGRRHGEPAHTTRSFLTSGRLEWVDVNGRFFVRVPRANGGEDFAEEAGRAIEVDSELADRFATADLTDRWIRAFLAEERPVPRDRERALVVGPDSTGAGGEGGREDRFAIGSGSEHYHFESLERRGFKFDRPQRADVD